MNHQTLKELARVQGPAVSILCPLEVRGPGSDHDSLLLRELRDRAAKEVEALLPGPDATSLIARVDDALGSVNLQHSGAGVAILVNYPLDERAHAEAAKFVFRAVDHALATLERADPRPVVLVGEERDLAYFDEVTRQRDHLIGRVHGNHQRDTPDAVAHLVRPVLDDHHRRQQIDASDEVREAVGSRAVCGIADTWLAALEGRGHRLVVEDGYRFPARVVDGVLEAAPGDNDAFDAFARTVEEVIRRDGDVVAVPAGSLEDLEHIALLIRF